MSEYSKHKTTRRALIGTLGVGALTSSISALAAPPPARNTGTARTVPSLVAIKDGGFPVKEGEIIQTLGYYTPGDGGGACYSILKTAGEEYTEPVAGKLFARLLSAEYVNYRMFGVKSDGQSDDGEAIRKAHIYANRHRIPVINLSGEYWLKQTKRIPIQTNTYWGNTVFHIDESFNVPRDPHFDVMPDEEAREIQLSPEVKAALISKLRPGTKFIPELSEFKNCFVDVRDENDRIGIRHGDGYSKRGWAREEFFYVEEHGRIIGDLAWTFKDYTHLTVYPCSNSYLVIDGGTFLVTGDNPGELGGPYHQSGFHIRRSRTIIQNQWVGLEAGKEDISLTPRAGFYTFNYVYDVLLENVRLIPWEQRRDDPNKIVKAGTYGIGGNRVLCATFRNITAEGGPIHWGIFGTNLFKNFRIENCRLNRVDVHFHGWNITIRDSEVGQKGLTLTGGGELIIENTRVFNNVFLNLRNDYGAKWDGPIRILNSRVIAQTPHSVNLITMTAMDFDYKYPVVFGRQLLIHDFVFETVPEWDNVEYALIRFPRFSVSGAGGRLEFPNLIDCRNILVDGRERGIRLFDLPDISSFHLGSMRGGKSNGRIQTNSKWKFDNIHLDDKLPALSLNRTKPYVDEHALYPSIGFSDCSNLKVHLGDISGTVEVRNSELIGFDAGRENGFEGKILFDNCSFQAEVPDSASELFVIRAKSGVSFSNCEVNMPLLSGKPDFESLGKISFLKLNEQMRFNHLNTRLGGDVLEELEERKIKLKPAFISMLKGHHELEA